jgi:hypothetical protein
MSIVLILLPRVEEKHFTGKPITAGMVGDGQRVAVTIAQRELRW